MKNIRSKLIRGDRSINIGNQIENYMIEYNKFLHEFRMESMYEDLNLFLLGKINDEK